MSKPTKALWLFDNIRDSVNSIESVEERNASGDI